MSRYYDDPIAVTLGADGTPARLVWRGTTYRVRQVFARWHLRDRWWDAPPLSPLPMGRGVGGEGPSGGGPADASAPTGVPPQSPPARAGDRADAACASATPSPQDVEARHVAPVGLGDEGPSDRYYYRLCCTPSLICDVYRDAAGDGWRLEYLHD